MVRSLAIRENSTPLPALRRSLPIVAAAQHGQRCFALVSTPPELQYGHWNVLPCLVNTEGESNTAIGLITLSANRPGSRHTAIGFGALQYCTAPPDFAGNTAIGTEALFSDTTGNFNTAVGDAALKLNTTGADNTAIGLDALVFNDIGAQNTATGANALFSNTAGEVNTAIGVAPSLPTLPATSTQVSVLTPFSPTTPEAQTPPLVTNALEASTGNGNTALGADAGLNVTTANNIDIGNSGVAGESSMIRIGDLAVHAGIFLAGITAMSPTAPNQAMLVDPATGQLGSADVGILVGPPGPTGPTGATGDIGPIGPTRSNRRYGRNRRNRRHWAK